ncbi:ABC transporter ATP-binding protein [Rhodococcus sp. IEGM 1381]|uniref:ABC transporter ATP-binding protein n=1 Tax=Rhodococcus sp. IEGM 1381 TaxID=3047085 RepID=UPI0024B69187|nr:ABC transporter ATP-binding protein [Rhodococcus sp. IEGM 1381]MDI9894211.1 ABC transporter ATP-binding protein [Rhodococcus sp. IEGM 1381]
MAESFASEAFRSTKFALGLAFRADPRRTVSTGFFQIVGALAAIGTVVIGKVLLERILDDGATSPQQLLWPLLGLALVTAVTGSIAVIRGQQERLLGERVSQLVWNKVLDVVTNVDLMTYEQPGFITEYANVERGGMTRPLPMTKSVFGLIGAGLGVSAMLIALMSIAPVLAPILFLGAVPAVIVSRLASRSEFAFSRRLTPAFMRREYLRRVLTHREYAAEIRSFGAAPNLRSRHSALDAVVGNGLKGQVASRTKLALVQTAGSALSLVAVLLVIVYMLDRGLLTLPQAGAAAIAVRILGSQLSSVYSSFSALTESAPFVSDLNRFLRKRTSPAGRAEPMTLQHRLTLSDVQFRYPGRDDAALADIDMFIDRGEVVALVGENGSGKTTLANIVAGLYEPDSGEVRWDEVPLERERVRASVTMVFQDFAQFSLSVTDNIDVAGQSSADPGRVHTAAFDAQLTDTIASLPSGFDTMLGRDLDEGLDLSGGQWQRMALARALLKNSSLIVLDEPSAALDPRAENELFNDVRRVLNGRAALLISHRYSNVKHADRIYVLDGGRVVECGSHRELMRLGGKYADLFTLQSTAYSMETVDD